jgi:sugar phosphate permease
MTGIFTGWLVDNYSWEAGFWYWIIAALVAAFIMLALWRVPVVEESECS